VGEVRVGRAPFAWQDIETVLLDMDGTLLDKHYDDYFWEQYVPEVYSQKEGISIPRARQVLLEKYRSREGTLDWTSLDYWSEQLDLDIPALKLQVEHLIQVHPYVVEFLEYCRKIEKKLYLVTNAHNKTLDIKMNKTALRGHFDRIVCAEEVGVAKEDPVFWEGLREIIPYRRAATMLAEDTAKILHSAKEYGIAYLVYVARPSSSKGVSHENDFISIEYFNELMESGAGNVRLGN